LNFLLYVYKEKVRNETIKKSTDIFVKNIVVPIILILLIPILLPNLVDISKYYKIKTFDSAKFEQLLKEKEPSGETIDYRKSDHYYLYLVEIDGKEVFRFVKEVYLKQYLEANKEKNIVVYREEYNKEQLIDKQIYTP